MRKVARCLLAALAVFTAAAAPAKEVLTSDSSIARRLIAESIAAYPGNCPCPYSTARNGSRCGKRSAYSRPGGQAPLCYEEDVDKRSVQAWRERSKR